MKQLTGFSKAVLIFGGIGLAVWGVNKFAGDSVGGYFKPRTSVEASVPKFDTFGGDKSAAAFQHGAAAPTTIALDPSKTDYTAKVLTIPWNAMAGLSYANGGAETVSGSLMSKAGVRLVIERQDEYSKMQADLVKFSEQVAKGVKYPTEGAAFAIIMGDGAPGFLGGAQEALQKVAKGQQLVVIAGLGYSRGEDKCVIDASASPRGALVKGVLGDGDINVCIQYASDNNIAINTDQKTYDPNAINFSGADSFDAADKAFIAHAKERRHNVVSGKDEDIEINGSATWTPGDVNLAKNRGHIKVLASTQQYMWQMPSTLIGNKQWIAENHTFVDNMVAAALKGGEIVRSDQAALQQTGAIQAKIFKEQDAAYWAKYFNVQNENGVSLGGSTTNGLGDNLYLFGLNGNDSLYKRVYNTFGKITVRYFPDSLNALTPYEQVVDTSVIERLASKTDASALAVAKPSYTNTVTTGTFANKAVSIEFDSGKATLTAAGIRSLNEVIDNLAASGLPVEVRGHTDNVGNPETNLALSKARADAVKKFIQTNASSVFPEGRLRSKGYGDTTPIADNKSATGRATNRRVEIVQLTTSN